MAENIGKDFSEVICCTCGIEFGISQKVVDIWTNSEKSFCCPNGHPLCWKKSKETIEQKELLKLRVEVKELKEKLETALKFAEDHQTKIEDLISELELWTTGEKRSYVSNQ